MYELNWESAEGQVVQENWSSFPAAFSLQLVVVPPSHKINMRLRHVVATVAVKRHFGKISNNQSPLLLCVCV